MRISKFAIVVAAIVVGPSGGLAANQLDLANTQAVEHAMRQSVPASAECERLNASSQCEGKNRYSHFLLKYSPQQRELYAGIGWNGLPGFGSYDNVLKKLGSAFSIPDDVMDKCLSDRRQYFRFASDVGTIQVMCDGDNDAQRQDTGYLIRGNEIPVKRWCVSASP